MTSTIDMPTEDLDVEQLSQELAEEEELTQQETSECSGGCPECGDSDGCLNVGREHWGVCHQHRTKWWVGSDLFSSWREESSEQHEANARLLESYHLVEPPRAGL